MSSDLIVYGALFLLFVAMGGFLFAGRGAWLIAGYNTMPKKERERYDKRALCRFMGKLMFFCAACMLVMGADTLWPGRGLGLAGTIWLLIGAVGAVIYANTGGRFLKKTPGSSPERAPDKTYGNRPKDAPKSRRRIGFRRRLCIWHTLCTLKSQLRVSNRSEVSSFI